tara:strand:+ start:1309 stop:1725 length:417 start_codon:yes stop_codon:yes gene_type:complete
MLKTPADTLKKTCLIGLTYFDLDGKELKRQLLAGTVVAVDAEMGITVALLSEGDNASAENTKSKKQANFIIPATLSCWFKAPKGDFHTSHEQVKIVNPDYLVTWDIYQTKKPKDEKAQEGVQQWWKWYPRTQDPMVNE